MLGYSRCPRTDLLTFAGQHLAVRFSGWALAFKPLQQGRTKCAPVMRAPSYLHHTATVTACQRRPMSVAQTAILVQHVRRCIGCSAGRTALLLVLPAACGMRVMCSHVCAETEHLSGLDASRYVCHESRPV